MPVCDRVITEEISNDYTLPDYQPEIRRILHVEANILPPAKYVNSNSAEFNGNIDYSVMYVGSDGALYSVPLIAEYNLETNIDSDNSFDFNDGVTSCTDISSENITTRLLGPRKLNIKCRLKAHVRAYATMILDQKAIGEVSADSIRILEDKCEYCTFSRMVSESLDLNEEIIPESNNCRVVGADTKIFIENVTAGNEEVSVKGEIYLYLLTTNDEDQYQTKEIQRKIPFVHTIESEDITDKTICCAVGIPSDLSITMEKDRIICNVSVIIDVETQRKEMFTYTKDIYSTSKECECNYKMYTLPTAGYCINGNFSVNDRLSKADLGLPQSFEIVNLYAFPNVDKLENTGNKNVITGQVKYTMLICSEGEYSAVDIFLPTKYEFESQNSNSSSLDANMKVICCHARQDSDNLSIDAEIEVCAKGAGNIEINSLSEVEFTSEIKKKKGMFRIYYPSKDDSLWSVAKKFNVSSETIDQLNQTNGNIEGKNYLIV